MLKVLSECPIIEHIGQVIQESKQFVIVGHELRGADVRSSRYANSNVQPLALANLAWPHDGFSQHFDPPDVV